jgi:hypothetical protein
MYHSWIDSIVAHLNDPVGKELTETDYANHAVPSNPF